MSKKVFPKYLVFDGIDGAGKTSIISSFKNFLKPLNITAILIEEPSYGPFGQEVRSIIKSSEQRNLDEEHRLFTLDRKDHVKKKISPLLNFVETNPGFLILQDRGFLSAPAYQAKDRTSIEKILQEQRIIAPSPDHFIIVDVPVNIALERIKIRKKREELTEKQHALEKARERFLWLANNLDESVLVLDGSLDPSINCSIILDKLKIH